MTSITSGPHLQELQERIIFNEDGSSVHMQIDYKTRSLAKEVIRTLGQTHYNLTDKTINGPDLLQAREKIRAAVFSATQWGWGRKMVSALVNLCFHGWSQGVSSAHLLLRSLDAGQTNILLQDILYQLFLVKLERTTLKKQYLAIRSDLLDEKMA